MVTRLPTGKWLSLLLFLGRQTRLVSRSRHTTSFASSGSHQLARRRPINEEKSDKKGGGGDRLIWKPYWAAEGKQVCGLSIYKSSPSVNKRFSTLSHFQDENRCVHGGKMLPRDRAV